jgi:hypothetical protein
MEESLSPLRKLARSIQALAWASPELPRFAAGQEAGPGVERKGLQESAAMQSRTETDPTRLAGEEPSGGDPGIQIPLLETPGVQLRRRASPGRLAREWR